VGIRIGPSTVIDERGLWPRFGHPRVGAYMSTRQGGVSAGAFASFNLRPGIGDDEQRVAVNRLQLQGIVGRATVRVDQVHGAQVHVVTPGPAGADDATLPVADASVSIHPGLACEIQVADCLPVLFADVGGRVVGAAHAGWRGLAGGVLEACLARVCEQGGVEVGAIEAWLGPCIGPQCFEVGLDVLQAFGSDATKPGSRFSAAHDTAGSGAGPRWYANLAGLARDRLLLAGVHRLGGNDSSAAWCSVSNPSRFFSYRRDRLTGRMAALIWLDEHRV
jgi:polyphenol oxidase